MQLQLSVFIEDNLAEIADFIAKDNPQRAVSFVKELRSAITEISNNPLNYRVRPEITNNTRMAVVGRYVILFQIRGDIIQVERVLHGARHLPDLML